ncbi:MAG: WD40 repeat domain-containing protein, partial [bacterium]|nr:WD40 repeat domain-containing protein [bacterium]
MKRALALPALLLAAVLLPAASPTAWEMNTYKDFLAGRFQGISLSRDGRLELAPKLETLFSSEQPAIWSVARATDGTLYLGTGHRGRLYRLGKNGKNEVIWTADEPEIFAVALNRKGDLFAATSPNGKVYRIDNGEAVEYFDPPDTYIWSLAFSRDGTLYVGAGDKGTVYRVTERGAGEEYYKTGQYHVTCLAF